MFPVISISKSKNFLYLFVFLIIEEISDWLGYWVFNYFEPGFSDVSVDMFKGMSLTRAFMILVLIAPFIETIICQFAIIELLKKLKLSNQLTVLITAVIFGLLHDYNGFYIVMTVVAGFIFAYYYVALREQGRWYAIFYVFLLHGLANLIAFYSTDF